MSIDRQTQIFVDGFPRTRVPKNICDLLDDQFMSIRSSGSISFTGIVWGSKLAPTVFLPKGSIIPKERGQQQKIIGVLLKCLQRYESSASKAQSSNTHSDGLSCPELQLLELYQRNGLYSNRESHSSSKLSGAIDWKRSINSGNPTVNTDGTLFYLDTIKRGYRLNETQIRKINAALVHQAISEFSWLIPVRACDEVMAAQRMAFSNETAIRLINIELSQQFSNEKIRILKLLLAVLENRLTSSKSVGSLFGTARFEHVWEHMISSYLADQKNEFKGLAVPAYVHHSGVVAESAANSPRPDTILHEGGRVAIIDAKYYDFATSKPQWSDLVKQFFYAKTFNTTFEKSKVSNWLVVPGSNALGIQKAVVINADKTHLDREFPPIGIRFINPFEVMNYYASYQINSQDRASLLAGELNM